MASLNYRQFDLRRGMPQYSAGFDLGVALKAAQGILPFTPTVQLPYGDGRLYFKSCTYEPIKDQVYTVPTHPVTMLTIGGSEEVLKFQLKVEQEFGPMPYEWSSRPRQLAFATGLELALKAASFGYLFDVVSLSLIHL